MNRIQHTHGADDQTLAEEEMRYRRSNRAVQIGIQLIEDLRGKYHPGMTYEDMHREFPALRRMQWLEARPDRRQVITTALIGTKPATARKHSIERQAADIEEAIENNDADVEMFDEAFSPDEIAIYGDMQAYWRLFFKTFDWKMESEETCEDNTAYWLIRALLEQRDNLESVLTHLQVRRAISSVAWNTYLPVEVRAKIDDARNAQLADEPTKVFSAEQELELVDLLVLVEHIPLKHLKPLIKLGIEHMGFTLEDASATATPVDLTSLPPDPLTDEVAPESHKTPVPDAGPTQQVVVPRASRMPSVPLATSGADDDDSDIDNLFNEAQDGGADPKT